MNYEMIEQPEGLLIRLFGRLDAYATPAVEGALIQAVATSAGALAIDCAGVSYVSSAGLRVLLVAAKAMKASGRRLGLVAVTPDVMDVITLAGMTSFFDVSRAG
jgi:anti-anti-sigma factor